MGNSIVHHVTEREKNALMIKSSLTQITQQAVEERQVCTHGDVIISQDSSYVYISSKGQGKKPLNSSRKMYLIHSLSLRNWVISCIDTKMSIFVTWSLQKRVLSKNIVKLSNIKKKKNALVESSRVFWVGKKSSYIQKPVLVLRNYYGCCCYFIIFSQKHHRKVHRRLQNDCGSLAGAWSLNGLFPGLTQEREGTWGGKGGRDCFPAGTQQAVHRLSSSCLGASLWEPHVSVHTGVCTRG